MKTNEVKKANKPVTDERIDGVANKGLAVAGVIAIIYAAAMLAYKIITDQNPIPEVILLVAMSVGVLIVQGKNKVYSFPTTILGKPLDVSQTKEGKIKRILHYVVDALCFGLIFGGLDHFIDGIRFPEILFNVGFACIVSFVFDYLWTEHRVKKYNAYMDSICDDE